MSRQWIVSGIVCLNSGLFVLNPLALPAYAAQVSPTAAQQSEPLRLVILPFRNLTDKAEDQWLGNSFAESLTMGLLKVRALRVIERNQLTALLKEQQLGQSGLADESSAPQLGKLLGAKVVVIGSYQKVGDMLQANVRLVNAETGQVDPDHHARIQGRFESIFELQNELAEKLITQLEVKAQPAEVKEMQAVFRATRSPEAYRHYIQGMQFLRNYNSSQEAQMIESFQAAIKADANYALPYAALAEVYGLQAGIRQTMRVLPSEQSQGPDAQTLARQYAEKALTLDPELPEVLRALAKLEWLKGEKVKGLEKIKRAIQLAPWDVDSVSAFVSFRFEQAGFGIKPDDLNQELQALGAHLQDPWMMYQLAAVGIVSEATKPAEKRNLAWIKTNLDQANKALKDHPGLALLQLTLAQLEGNAQAQEMWFNEALRRGATNPAILALLANQRVQQKDIASALNLIDQAQALAPEDLTVAMQRAHILYLSGQKTQAETLFNQLEAKTSQNPYIAFLRGMNYFGDEDLKKAKPYLEKALKYSEGSPESGMVLSSLQLFLALCYVGLEEWNSSTPLLQALRNDPIYYGLAYDFLSKVYHIQEKHPEALEAYTAYLTIHPEVREQPEVQLNYRLYYLMDLVGKKPKDLNVLLDLGQTLTQLEYYQAAQKYLAQANDLAPESPVVYSRLGYLALVQQKWEEARQLFQAAVQRAPSDSKSWYNLALACQALGDKAAARKAVEEVLKHEPGHVEALQLRQSL
ncbi:MAG: tetratricopeptide repeat protein [Candidatus Sericytochromatia bacterium]|nr:tetratricopeptide repeat protein [Candidatus Sericytochromatia bacterium]